MEIGGRSPRHGNVEARECLEHQPRSEPFREPAQRCTAVYAALLLFTGIVLHPALKIFYRQGEEYGQAKNTLSVVDFGLAVTALLTLRLMWPRRSGCEPVVWTTVMRKTALPGLCIFGSISLATLANYQSLWTFLTLAPLEIVFVVLITVVWQRVFPSRWQMGSLAIVLIGAIMVTAADLQRARRTATNGWTLAVGASAAFRLNQAVATVVIRNVCVALRENTSADVLDIAICKLSWACVFCIPYSCAIEGLSSWSTLANSQGSAFWLILLSVVLTCFFQTANVGLNNGLRSVSATLVMQLQPVAQLCAACLLSVTSLSDSLQLHREDSALGLVGLLFLLLGDLVYITASRSAA